MAALCSPSMWLLLDSL